MVSPCTAREGGTESGRDEPTCSFLRIVSNSARHKVVEYKFDRLISDADKQRAEVSLGRRQYTDIRWRIQNTGAEDHSVLCIPIQHTDIGKMDELCSKCRQSVESIFKSTPTVDPVFNDSLIRVLGDEDPTQATGDEPVITETRQRRRWWQLWLPR